jgi:hypothetical protein
MPSVRGTEKAGRDAGAPSAGTSAVRGRFVGELRGLGREGYTYQAGAKERHCTVAKGYWERRHPCRHHGCKKTAGRNACPTLDR